jgi:hypothetical protein
MNIQVKIPSMSVAEMNTKNINTRPRILTLPKPAFEMGFSVMNKF